MIFYEPGVILRENHDDDPGFTYWICERDGWRVVWSTCPVNTGIWVEEEVVRDVIADWELCYYLPGTPADEARHAASQRTDITFVDSLDRTWTWNYDTGRWE